MISLLLLGGFQAILLALLLLAKKGKRISDYLLATHFIISALTIVLAYFEILNQKSNFPFPWLISLSIPSILLVGPSLWIYVKSLTQQHFTLKRIYLLLLLPFGLILTLLTVRYIVQPDELKIMLQQTEGFKKDFAFPITVALIAISNIGYTAWGLRLIAQYRQKIRSYFSQTESIDLKWLSFLLYSSLISYALISGLYLLDYSLALMKYETLQLISYGIASLFVLALGFFGLKQGSVFTSTPLNFDLEKVEIVDEKLPISRYEEEFVRKLLDYMKVSKPHLNPDLTLSKLSDELNVSSEYLSGVLNGRLSMNFFDFVNHHRIEEFKSLCRNPKSKNLTLISLAYDSGFNSKPTFNRVFKKEMGCTPSQFYSKVSIS
jgi:AraC-like DNA-binding protein